MKIGCEHLDDLSLGAVFLATGGGGDPYAPKLVTDQVLSAHGPIDLLPVDALDDEAFVVTIGSVGAPTVSLELLPSVDEAAETLAAYQDLVGRPVDAVVSFEIGGGNSLIPMMAAAVHNIPVIDGDGMGRALPEAQMMTYPIAGIAPTPALARDYLGGITTFTAPTTEIYERQVRAIALSMGGMITTAEHPMTGAQLKSCIIPGTVSFSLEIGRTLREKRGQAETLLAPLQEAFRTSVYGECRLLFSGKVTDKATRIIGGFDIGTAIIEGFGASKSVLEIAIKNEYLVARLDGEILASVPDLITIVDQETGTPINAERLRYGQRVSVFAVGCPDFYRSERALEAAGPRAFGFDFDFIPLEERMAAS